MDADRKEALVIVNPAAHNLPSKKALAAADEWLRSQGWHVRWEETDSPGSARALALKAAEERLPLLFVCGGDGSMGEAANGLAGSDTALAMIAAGTVNIWARETQTPKKPLDAVRAAVSGERRRVDLGKAGDRYFLLMAGYGLDGHLARKVSLGAKRHVGATAYALAAVRESITYRSKPLSLTLDGDTVDAQALMLVAGNTRNYAGLVEITPQARLDDGLLDVCLFQGKGLLDIMLHVIGVALRRHTGSKKVLYRKAKRIELGWEEPLPIQPDGDAFPESPPVIEVAPRALWVTVPKGASLPLFSE
ncbi:MAG: diacylglycerol kinase family lipid kinase [Chloroflexi bacterium]|nr:diacylglycerol kinase family lipid kinase [Chloroflexota bacterium]